MPRLKAIETTDADPKAKALLAEWERVGLESATREGVQPTAWFDVEGEIIGEGRSWDDARINTFPSRAAFITYLFDRTRLEAHQLREQATADSYVLVMRPIIDRLADSVTDHTP